MYLSMRASFIDGIDHLHCTLTKYQCAYRRIAGLQHTTNTVISNTVKMDLFDYINMASTSGQQVDRTLIKTELPTSTRCACVCVCVWEGACVRAHACIRASLCVQAQTERV